MCKTDVNSIKTVWEKAALLCVLESLTNTLNTLHFADLSHFQLPIGKSSRRLLVTTLLILVRWELTRLCWTLNNQMESINEYWKSTVIKRLLFFCVEIKLAIK